jgi:acyl-CoA reductase-like NAD-dependent aldehyde dehydrogenase
MLLNFPPPSPENMAVESRATAVKAQDGEPRKDISSTTFVSKTPFPRISAAHIEGSTRSVRHRQQQFHRLHSTLVSSKSQLVEALSIDNDFTDTEALFEYSLALFDLRHMYESLNLEAELAASNIIGRGHDGLLRKVGLGIVYIMPEKKKSSLYSVLSPLGAAMAAGNCVIVEVVIKHVPVLRDEVGQIWHY